VYGIAALEMSTEVYQNITNRVCRPLLQRLAQVHSQQNDPRRALPYLLSMLRAAAGERRRLNELLHVSQLAARVYTSLGRFAQAEQCLKRAIAALARNTQSRQAGSRQEGTRSSNDAPRQPAEAQQLPPGDKSAGAAEGSTPRRGDVRRAALVLQLARLYVDSRQLEACITLLERESDRLALTEGREAGRITVLKLLCRCYIKKRQLHKTRHCLCDLQLAFNKREQDAQLARSRLEATLSAASEKDSAQGSRLR